MQIVSFGNMVTVELVNKKRPEAEPEIAGLNRS